jgi:glutamate/tyrosine decarboxylase-like PLP-dependent enzyme
VVHQRATDPDSPGFFRHAEVDELRLAASRPLPQTGTSLHDLIGDLRDLVEPLSVRQSSSRYLAFPDSANSIAAATGAILGRLLNQNMISVDRGAPIATFIEIQVLEWLRALVGYDTKALVDIGGVGDLGGLWAPGGHLSNHVAMLTALGHRFPEARRAGLASLCERPLVVMAGAIAHYSHSDAAFHLGLGWDSVLQVPSQQGFMTDPKALETALDCAPGTPFMVVAVAGNCRTTGLDPIEEIADVCESRGLWLHVDACHGGALLFSPRLCARNLAGVERADSISLDPHKGLFTPYPSSYVLFRDRTITRQFSRHQAAVRDPQTWDLGQITPFLGSRGFESLATWMLMRHIGVDALGALVEARQSLSRLIEQRLWSSGLFVCLNDVDFYRVAFVFLPASVRQRVRKLARDPQLAPQLGRLVGSFSSRLGRALYEHGEVCLDEQTLLDLDDRTGLAGAGSLHVLAACPGNPLVDWDRLGPAMRELEVAAAQLVPAFEHEVDQLSAAPGGGGRDQLAPRLASPAGWSEAP